MGKLIVSFTSYPGRIDSVKQVLDSLYAQTLPADEIILWLAEDEFPNKEADLPKALKDDLLTNKFSLRWCDNLGSHKKYFYAMQEYPEDIIVTVDDDTYYHPNSLQLLMEAHRRFPGAVAAFITSLVEFDTDYNPLPVNEWIYDFHELEEPSMLLMAIGVGGVLYPPHAVDMRIFDKQLIQKNCKVKGRICGDDILLKAGEMLKGTPVVSVLNEVYYRIPNTQNVALSRLTPSENHKNHFVQTWKNYYRDAFDESSINRLRTEISLLEQKEKNEMLSKKHWLASIPRGIKKQIWYLLLPNAPTFLNEEERQIIKTRVQGAARKVAAYEQYSSKEEIDKVITSLRQLIMKLPDINTLMEEDVTVRALIEYGLLLGTRTMTQFNGIPIYSQNQKNWRQFLNEHPYCEKSFLKGYAQTIVYTLLAYNRNKLKYKNHRQINKKMAAYLQEAPHPFKVIRTELHQINAKQRRTIIASLPGVFLKLIVRYAKTKMGFSSN